MKKVSNTTKKTDLSIAKSKRAKGIYYHKMPSGINACKAKEIAMKDISEECMEGGLFTRNYVSVESTVLKTTKIFDENEEI